MGSFITNFQSPVELDDLIDRFQSGGVTNLNMILDRERYASVEWTVDKNATVGDTVYFMCAKTSVDHMGHLCALLRKAEVADKELLAYAEAQRKLYREKAGQIIAVGQVADEPFSTWNSGWNSPYWRSPWYARIDNIRVLDRSVNIAEFRDFIQVSRTGAITKLTNEQDEGLQKLIAGKEK